MILVWATVTLRSPTAVDLRKMSNKKGPSEVYHSVDTLQAGVGFSFCDVWVGYGHPFAAAFAAFVPLVTRGSRGGDSRGRCSCFQEKVLRHSPSHLCLSHLFL